MKTPKTQPPAGWAAPLTEEHLDKIIAFCRSRLAMADAAFIAAGAAEAGWRATIEGIQCARAALRDLELVPPGRGSTIKSLMEGALRMILVAYPLQLVSDSRPKQPTTMPETIQQPEGGAAVRSSDLLGFPPVVDVCCGSRMFWFDRADARAVFVDNRRETHTLPDVSSAGGSRTLTVSPDILADFTDLPFPDGRFALVVFDPPHLLRAGPKGWQAKKYGKLTGDWREMLRRGFAECFRVLRAEGTLIFKWNEHEIPVSEILALTPEKPLVGQRCGKTAKTHWLVFLKGGGGVELGESERERQTQNDHGAAGGGNSTQTH